jgi:type I restriction enzyme M protein
LFPGASEQFSSSISHTIKHFTLKECTPKRIDLDEFVACCLGGSGVPPLETENMRQDAASTKARNRFNRVESERFKSFTYDELTKRDKASLDIFWLKDDSLEASANFPAPGVLALEITEDLEAALEQLAVIAEDLNV